MRLNWLSVFPLCVALLIPVTFSTTYIMATTSNHTRPFFSYISDTGTLPPEMCVFALGLATGMIFVSATVYIRYKQVEYFLEQIAGQGQRLNFIGLILGLLCAFGTGLVGCFQETNLFIMHVLAADLAFGCGSVYAIIQGVFTLKMIPTFGSNLLAYVRLSMGSACLILFVTSGGTGAASLAAYTGSREPLQNILHWQEHDGGWELRKTSVITEWIMAAIFALYFLTFVPEFRKLVYIQPHITTIEDPIARSKDNNLTSIVMQKSSDLFNEVKAVAEEFVGNSESPV